VIEQSVLKVNIMSPNRRPQGTLENGRVFPLIARPTFIDSC